MSTCFDGVDDWPAECRAELFEQIDTVFHSGAISLVECGEPFLEQVRADDGPRHWCRVGSTSPRWRIARRSRRCVTDRSVAGLMSMAIAERARPEDDPTEQVALVHRPMGTQF